MQAKRRSYSTAVLIHYQQGILSADILAGIPYSTRHNWRNRDLSVLHRGRLYNRISLGWEIRVSTRTETVGQGGALSPGDLNLPILKIYAGQAPFLQHGHPSLFPAGDFARRYPRPCPI